MIKDGQFCIDLPATYKRRELNTLYREIPLKDAASRLLRKYFNAMANLYGIIPLRKAYAIISEQSPKLVTRDQFLAFAEIARHECEDYYLLGPDELYAGGKLKNVLDREIIDIALIEDNLDSYHALLQSQQGKTYYIPEKAQLLAYEDAFYCEPTEAAMQLRRFLEVQLQLTDEQVSAVFDELVYGTRCVNADLAQIQGRLAEMQIQLRRSRDLQAFIKLYQAFRNNARLQCNRGHTPEELLDLLPHVNWSPQSMPFEVNSRALTGVMPSPTELQQGILRAGLPNEKTPQIFLKGTAVTATKPPSKGRELVGRNDPCPCGSGKKYKRCCGR